SSRSSTCSPFGATMRSGASSRNATRRIFRPAAHEKVTSVPRLTGGYGRGIWVEPSSAGLAVEGVLVVPPAELLHLDALAVVDARLHRDVVPPLADLAGQRDLQPLLVRLARHVSLV